MPSVPFYVEPNDPPSKQEILKAALRLFVRDGVNESSVRAVAAEAGFTNPVLFKYFESKEALTIHLFERCYGRLAREVARATTSDRPFEARLHALIQAVIGLFEEAPEAVLFVNEELRRLWPRASAATKRLSVHGLTTRFFEEGVREGRVTRDMSVPLLVAAFWGLLGQFCRLYYFKEFSGEVREAVLPIEALVGKMLAP